MRRAAWTPRSRPTGKLWTAPRRPRARRPAAGPAQVGLAQVAYQRNELDAALEEVTEGISLCRRFVYTVPLAAGLATLAWIRQASGDPSAAAEAMGEAERSAQGSAGLLNPVSAQRIRLLLAQGDVAAAAQWAQESGLSEKDEPDYPREPGQLILARVLLAQDRPGRRWRCWTGCTPRRRPRAVPAASSRPARCARWPWPLAATGEGGGGGAGRDAGTRLLARPRPGFRRRGPADGHAARPALAARRAGQAAADVPLGYLARLQHAVGAGLPPESPAESGLIDPLTSRELEVLRMLAAGQSNQAIAAELVVTLDTVKKHVGHVLGKLGAANRTEAVARARQLSLIP